MKTYHIQASESVFYDVEIEANNEREAEELFMNEVMEGTITADDGEGFQIDSLTELE